MSASEQEGPHKRRRPVTKLENAVNEYGRTIYVQEWEEHTGKPKIWYEFNKQKILVKRVRTPLSIDVIDIGKTRYIKF